MLQTTNNNNNKKNPAHVAPLDAESVFFRGDELLALNYTSRGHPYLPCRRNSNNFTTSPHRNITISPLLHQQTQTNTKQFYHP